MIIIIITHTAHNMEEGGLIKTNKHLHISAFGENILQFSFTGLVGKISNKNLTGHVLNSGSGSSGVVFSCSRHYLLLFHLIQIKWMDGWIERVWDD